jgi:hypothetical protein
LGDTAAVVVGVDMVGGVGDVVVVVVVVVVVMTMEEVVVAGIPVRF